MSQVLPDAARILATPGTVPGSLQRLARAAVPALGDFCFIFLVERDELRCAASAHVTREGHRLIRALNRVYRITRDDPVSTVAQAIRSGRPQLRPDIAAEHGRADVRPAVASFHDRLACRSALAVPIGSDAQILGALSLCYSSSGRRYSTHDIEAARRVATLIASFLRERAGSPLARGHAPMVARRPIRLRARA